MKINNTDKEMSLIKINTLWLILIFFVILDIVIINSFSCISFFANMQSLLYALSNEDSSTKNFYIMLFAAPCITITILSFMLFARRQDVKKLPKDFLKSVNLSDNLSFSFINKKDNFECSYNDVDSVEVIFWCYFDGRPYTLPIIRTITIKFIIDGKDYELESLMWGRMSRIHKIFKYLKYIKNFKYKFCGTQSKEIKLQYKDIFETYLKTDCPFEILCKNDIKRCITSDIVFLIMTIVFTFGFSILFSGSPFAWINSFSDGSCAFYIIGFIFAILFMIFFARIILSLYIVNKYKIK